MRRMSILFAALPALLLGACGAKDEPKARPEQPAAQAPAAPPATHPHPPPPAAPPEPAFRPMGVGERPAASTSAVGKRLTGTWAKSDKPPTAGSAQVTMVNSTSITLDLYVDGGYGCRALRNLMCTTQVTPGTLTLEVRGPEGESASEVVVVEEGSSFTWTITE